MLLSYILFVSLAINVFKEGLPWASTKLGDVSNKICHALLSSNPKSRYLVGRDAKTVLFLLATLPSSFGDYVWRILLKNVIPAAMKE